jgi:hypothetical protein
MKRRPEPEYLHGKSSREKLELLIEKAGGDPSALNASGTARAIGESMAWVVEAIDARERILATGRHKLRERRQDHAKAWRKEFALSARTRWKGQSEASHWTVRQMAEKLRGEWHQKHSDYPCKQSTAEAFLKPLKAHISRELARKK